MDKSCGRFLDSPQNEPFLFKQKFKITEISHSIETGFIPL